MNLLRLSFLLVLILGLSACGSDDESSTSCVQSDWVGTYTGTVDCDGTVEDVTVTITASGTDAVIIKYESATMETEYDPITPDGCTIDQSQSDSGITLSLEVTLDGDNLRMDESIEFIGLPATNCNITASK